MTQWLIEENFITEEDKLPYHEFGNILGAGENSEKTAQITALAVSLHDDQSIFVLNNKHYLGRCDIDSGELCKSIGPIFNESDFPDHEETDHLYQEHLITSRDFLFIANNFKENKNI